LLLVIVHCAQCGTIARPGDDVCPNCQTTDHLMVGTHTPSGMRVSMHRDAKRLRIQGRRHPDGHMTYRASVGGPMPVPSSSYEPKKAPSVKVYSDVVWSYDRQSLERREMTTDSEKDYYRQEWFNLQTGERTYFKEGKLSDPEMHGESARRATS
jgi:hypothetical protein